jgi:hypothetical protein
MSVSNSTVEIDFSRVALVWSERLHLLTQEGGSGVDREGPLILALLQSAFRKDGVGVFCALMAITDAARDRARDERERRREAERRAVQQEEELALEKELREEQQQLHEASMEAARALHAEQLDILRGIRSLGATNGATAITPTVSAPMSPILEGEVTWLMGEVV